jgi:hypothetical protein
MIRRIVGSTMVLAAVLLAGESVQAASLTAIYVPVHAMGKTKDTVTFHLRNDSKEPLMVKAGSQEMTLEPGKLVDVTLKVGETVTVAKATPTFAEGAVVATASRDLRDSTVALQ